MKLVLFDDNRNIVDELLYLQNPRIFGRDEVRWDNGGVSGIKYHYVILEDEQNFADLSEEEILNQYKVQIQYEIAKQYDENRIDYLVNQVLEEEETAVKNSIIEVENKSSREEIVEVVNNRNRIAQERRNTRGRPTTLPTNPSNPSNPSNPGQGNTGQGNSGRAASQDVKIVFTEE